MLWAVPVERHEVQPQEAFGLGLVACVCHESHKSRVGIERECFDVRVDLESRAVRVVHEEQAGPIIKRKVTGADVLAVAAIVGKRQRAIID